MMTREQFALAVNADEKWVENSARLLGHPLKYSSGEARWIGLIRLFSRGIGLPLKQSARLATEAIRHPEWTRELRLRNGTSGAAAIVIDIARFHSAHNASLSAALTLAGPRKRGRPPGGRNEAHFRVRERPTRDTTWDVLARAKAYGIDLTALRDGLNETPAQRLQRLEDNVRFVAELRTSRTKTTRKGRGSKQAE